VPADDEEFMKRDTGANLVCARYGGLTRGLYEDGGTLPLAL
jgi:hypothetical protein